MAAMQIFGLIAGVEVPRSRYCTYVVTGGQAKSPQYIVDNLLTPQHLAQGLCQLAEIIPDEEVLPRGGKNRRARLWYSQKTAQFKCNPRVLTAKDAKGATVAKMNRRGREERRDGLKSFSPHGEGVD